MRRLVLVLMFLLCVSASANAVWVFGEIDVQSRAVFRGAIIARWFMDLEYAGTAVDAMTVNYTGSGNDIASFKFNGTEIVTIGTTGMTVSGVLVNTPSVVQVIDAVGDVILANAASVILDPNGDYTLTSAPTIADGMLGQELAITCANGEANTVTIQDQDALASSNIQLLNNVVSRNITGMSVVLLRFDGTDWIEFGGGGSGGADPLPVGHHFYTPTGDGSDNNISTWRISDGTNRRNFNRSTGGSDTQDMDWYAEVILSQAISSSKDITIYTRASDYANGVITMTVTDQSGNADSTGSVVITPSANDTWQAKTYSLTSAYTEDEVIWIKIALTSLDTADTQDFASSSIDL